MTRYMIGHIGDYNSREVTSFVVDASTKEEYVKIYSYTPNKLYPYLWETNISYSDDVSSQERAEDLTIRWANNGTEKELSQDEKTKGQPLEHKKIVMEVLQALAGK